jgi:hypothetical protein
LAYKLISKQFFVENNIFYSFIFISKREVIKANINPAQKGDEGPSWNFKYPPREGPIEPIKPVQVPINPITNPLDC